MTDDLVRGGTERTSSTIELFFDLVYVSPITQAVRFVHGEPTALGAGARCLTAHVALADLVDLHLDHQLDWHRARGREVFSFDGFDPRLTWRR